MLVKNKRLLLEYEQQAKKINREIINPEIKDLEITRLHPVLTMIARARADYLKTIFEEAAQTDNELSVERFENLRQKRKIYEELLNASLALRTAIERGYLDVEGSDDKVA